MPAFGDPNAPAMLHIAPEYIAGARDDIRMPNIVAAILASYRGYDTLGETAVVFTACVGVLLMLGRRRREDEERSEEHTSELQSLMRTSYAVLCLKKQIQ